MLPAIAAHAIAAHTQPGDLVLDPMAGIGTTIVEAMHAGRDAIGVEYEPRWANIADANTRHARAQGATGHGMIARGDSVDLPAILPAPVHGHISLVITSPPYGPGVHGHVRPTGEGIVKHADTYGEVDGERGNLAHHNHKGLIDGFTQILRGCAKVLTPGGVVVVTARPYRQRGELIDLPSAVIAAGRSAGLTLVERCYALLAGIRDGRLIARPSFFQLHAVRKARQAGVPMHLIVHEDVLVLAAPSKSTTSGEPERPQREPESGFGSTNPKPALNDPDEIEEVA